MSRASDHARYVPLDDEVSFFFIFYHYLDTRTLFFLLKYTMGRGVVHACHAGGVVHFLEGWKHHEVGAIDVDQINVVWEAALKHGLKPCR